MRELNIEQQPELIEKIINKEEITQEDLVNIDITELFKYDEIKKLGYSGTGRKYGVSDNSIRKWLKFYEKNKLEE